MRHTGDFQAFTENLFQEICEMPKTKKRQWNEKDCPTVWFAILEGARTKGDQPLIEEALRNLKRLGVSVEYQQEGDNDER